MKCASKMSSKVGIRQGNMKIESWEAEDKEKKMDNKDNVTLEM